MTDSRDRQNSPSQRSARDASQGRDRDSGLSGSSSSRHGESGMSAGSRGESPRTSNRGRSNRSPSSSSRGGSSSRAQRDIASEGPIEGVTGEDI